MPQLKTAAASAASRHQRASGPAPSSTGRKAHRAPEPTLAGAGRRAVLLAAPLALLAARPPAAPARRAKVDDSTINSGRAYARSKPLTETYGCTKLVDATYEGSTVQFCDLAVGTGLEGESGGGVKVTTVARGIENERTYDSKKGYTYPIDSEDGDINLRAAKGLDVAILGCEGMPPMKEGGRRVVRVPAEVAHGGNGIACLLGRKEKCLVPPDSGIEVYVEMISVAY